MKTNQSPGAALAAMRTIVDHNCIVCNKTFKAMKKAKFCSNRCKQKDKYERSKLNK